MPPSRKHENNAARQAAYRTRKDDARRLEREQKGLPASPAIPTIPGKRRWSAMIQKATALLRTIVEEREAYYDDRSEPWRESDRGDAFQERTTTIQEILDALETSADM